MTPEDATRFAGKELIKDDLVGISFGALSATDHDGKIVIDTLVADKVVDETAVVYAGLAAPPAEDGLVTPPASKELDLIYAEAISKDTVEIILSTMASADDLNAENLTLADSKGMTVNIASVSFAGWSGDNKDILVTLELPMK